MLKLLCKIGIHNYKWNLVLTKKEITHCRGHEELMKYDTPNYYDGRKCDWCNKEQYSVLNWSTIKYHNIIK